MHPPRSLLYVPASNPRALAKAVSLEADAIIVDLEDSVAPDAKADARAAMVEAVAAGFGGKPSIVRVNAVGTIWHGNDLAAVLVARPSAILWPKIADADEAEAVVHLADESAVWVMIETPSAVLSAERIARVDGVAALVLGLNDLAAALGATVGADRAELAYCMAHTVLAARAAGVMAFDGVPTALTNLDGVTAEATQAARMGFDGKTLVHPAQIAPTNTAFSPSAAALTEARALLAAWDARAAGAGVATYGGRLIEHMHVDVARRTLEWGETSTHRSPL